MDTWYRRLSIFLLIVSFLCFSPGTIYAQTGDATPRQFHITWQDIFNLIANKAKIFFISPQDTEVIAPTQTPTPRLKITPTASPSAYSSDVIQQYIMQEINDYRGSLNLPTVATSAATCDFAKIRAKEISSDFSHNGFTKRIDNDTFPFDYSKVTVNIAQTSNYKSVVTLWKNSTQHSTNMREDTPFVCVAYYGEFYAYVGMKP